MVENEQTAKEIALTLLKIKAVKLQPQQPFTWASGWKSPIYCDNRVTLSFPEVRKSIANGFAEIAVQHFKESTLVAGVATGAIAHGVLAAEQLQLPFVYVRSSAKDHGLGNLIEGRYHEGDKVLVIEDLISTGMSSLKAVDALRNANTEVLGMVSIFTYGFKKSETAFKEKNCKLISLTSYDYLIKAALETGYINNDDVTSLNNWKQNPEIWGQ